MMPIGPYGLVKKEDQVVKFRENGKNMETGRKRKPSMLRQESDAREIIGPLRHIRVISTNKNMERLLEPGRKLVASTRCSLEPVPEE